jgi:hypothetical protein
MGITYSNSEGFLKANLEIRREERKEVCTLIVYFTAMVSF